MLRAGGNMTKAIVSSGVWHHTAFGEGGIAHRPRLARGLELAWSEVEFVCVTPTLVREGERWREKPNSLLGPGFRSTLVTAGLLVLSLVVRDRRPVLERAGKGLNRLWAGSVLVPTLDAEGRFDARQGLITLDVYERRLSQSLDSLLDLLARHCRFDLVVDF
jgi:hypothetical protein